MFENIYVVTDLGPGDGGKGSVIHSLAQKIDASVIIKRGGAQGSHGVCTSHGESFNFSQWGCSTFEAVPTYLSPQMVISPVGLLKESDALKHHGIYDPFMMISASPSCICATPYHMISSQLEELFLGENPRGTIGTGVGRAYRMFQEFGDDTTIRAHDLQNVSEFSSKLYAQMEYYRSRYRDIAKEKFLLEDMPLVKENLDLLYDNGLFQYTVSLFKDIGKKLKLVDFSEVLKLNGTAIVECSHGVLTDAEEGIKPHVSAIRTLPSFTESMLRDSGYDGQITHLAVHRAYEIRHGAGPMPTYDPEFTDEMLPGSHKETNRWQGSVRAGPLDVCLLEHAIHSCSETKFDGICLTWMDQILLHSRNWKICSEYTHAERSSTLVEYFEKAIPIIENYQIPEFSSQDELFNFIKEIVIYYVDIPLKILSIGSTEKDKIIKI